MRGHLLLSQSSSPLHVLRVDKILFFGVHTCVARGTGAATRRAPLTLCVSLLPRGFQADVSHVVVAVVHRGHALPSRSMAGPTNPLLGCYVSRVCGSAYFCSRRCVSFRSVPLGPRALLDQFRHLLIDWSAEPVEPSLLVLGRPSRRSRGHQTHNASCCLPQALSLRGGR